MRVVVARSAGELAAVAADALEEALPERDAVIGIATGSSPEGVYAELARRVDAGALDLSGASAFALDEYVGLPASHPQCYRAVISRQVTAPLRLDPARVHVPDGSAADPEAEAAAFERRLRDAGGVDVQLLGIGRNGHIAFNEPGSALDSRTRVALLAPETIADNARFFDRHADVPRRAITQGVGTILDARRIVLVAQGLRKAEAVAHAIEGEVEPAWPASALQLHRDVVVVLDDEAASGLRSVRGVPRE